MSFIDCINNNKDLTDRQKKILLGEYDEVFQKYRETMGDETAAAAAAQKYSAIKAETLRKKSENAMRDALTWKRINQKIEEAAASLNDQKQLAGKGAFLFGENSTVEVSKALLEDVYTRHQALERRAQMAVAEAIEKYRSTHAGLKQDVEGFKDVVRAMLGERVDNAGAAADGAAFRDVFNLLHKMYKQEGGILGRIDNYFPQTHNPVLVKRAGFDHWRSSIWNKLDRAKMLDPETNLPMTDTRLQAALKQAYQGISSNGLNDLAERVADGKVTGGRGAGMALKRAQSRFLHFKDAESYLTYNREFGYGDNGLFNTVMHHIGTMTRDIAVMQALGPNPAAMIERIKLKSEAAGASPQNLRTLSGMYDVLAGRTSYHGDLPTWYKAMKGLQDWLRASYLGFAPISAMSDSFYAGWTARMNGLKPQKVLGYYFSLLNPASDADRRIAKRTALISSVASGHSFAMARFQDDIGSHGLLGWLASFTNRASGLATMTDAVRQSVIMGTNGFMAEARAAGTGWADLDPAMREAFARWDMNESDYKNITGSQPHIEHDGSDWIRPEDVAVAGHAETAQKYEMWLIDMGQDASNEPRLLTRAISSGAIFGDARPGTVLRATASSVMMFKSYGLTVVMNHTLPALQQIVAGRGMDRIMQPLCHLVGTGLLGAAAIQARQLAQGKTPRDMNNKRFWASALAQGGGLGIFGDFLLNDYSRFGNGFLATAGGPVLGFADDAARVLKGSFDKAIDDGQDEKFFANVAKLAWRNTPVLKMWYSRLLIERLALDHAQRTLDPNFDDRMRRLEAQDLKQYGQRSWWGASGG